MKPVIYAAALATAFPCHAADLSALPPPEGAPAQWGTLAVPCTHRLHGTITGGDLDRIISAQPPVRTLCLDSPGGEVGEGLALAQYFRDNSIGTRVAAGAICDSACALAFMGGFLAGDDGGGGGVIDRAIHPTAQLGFHAPRLIVEDGSYSETSVSAAYALSLRVLSRIVEVFVLPQQRAQHDLEPVLIPASLLKVIMDTPPQEMTRVTTVDQAGRWNIGVWPIAAAPAIGLEDFYRDCGNRVMWEADFSAVETRAFWHEWRAHPDYDGFAELRVVVDETGGLECDYMLDPDSMAADSIAAADQDYFTFDAYGSLGNLSTFAPETPLTDLPR